MPEITGGVDAAGLRFAIVASRFNKPSVDVIGRLIAGAMEALKDADVTLIRVPGAFEIPLAAKRAAESGRFDGIVALGCVIRGGTPHFEYISQAVTSGIARTVLDTGIPVAFGVLTLDTDEQAIARSEPGSTNKGFEAAMAAIEMVHLMKQF